MLKGTTKIELTDVNTGETQVIEKHNAITGALQELFNPTLGHLTNESTLQSNIPVHTSFLGGLLLFDSRIDGDPLPIFAPEGANLIGCARYNTASTQGSKYFGSYDANESVFSTQDKVAKFVYNFTQAQANGTINSVCLTHRNGGFGVYRGDFGFKSATVKLANTIYSSPTIKLVRTDRDRTTGISSSATAEHLFAVDIDNDVAYYFTMSSSTTLVITKRRIGLKQYSLFGDNDAVIGEPITMTIPTAINSINTYTTYNFDVEEQTLYLTSNMPGLSSNYIEAGAKFTVTKYKLGDTSATQTQLTNLHTYRISVQNMFGYKGKIYTTATSVSITGSSVYGFTIVSHSFNDGAYNTHGVATSTASRSDMPKPMFAHSGRLFWQGFYSSTAGVGGLQVTDCVATPDETNTSLCGVDMLEYAVSGGYNFPIGCTPIINHPLLMYISNGSSGSPEGFYYLAHYLGTVNNLATPIVKAPTQTMKITYTIQEV